MAKQLRWDDYDYIPSVQAAGIKGAHRYAHWLLYGVAGFFMLFIAWAWWAEIDEVSRGIGRVIPSSQIQTIQHLEGGIVTEMLVREGQRVNHGDVIARINSQTANSEYRENLSRFRMLLATVARLEAEAEAREPRWPTELENNEAAAAAALSDQQSEYRARLARFNDEIATFEQMANQRRAEIAAATARVNGSSAALGQLNEELRIARSLLSQGAVAQVEILRLQRQASEYNRDIGAARAEGARAQAGLQEAENRINERRRNFEQEARRELSQKRSELQSVRELIEARRDRVDRTDIRSPVTGIVNRIAVNTIGGVIQPGGEVMSIVPIDDSLVIEAQLRPQDIGFIRPDHNAIIKITAYDFARYGALDARIENISADTITDQQGNQFYKVRLRTERAFLQRGDETLPIIPGMQATVEIRTGRKSVLEYLLNPVFRARDNALRER